MILRTWRDDDVYAFAEMDADPRVTEFFEGTRAREHSIARAATLRNELERDGYGYFVAEVKHKISFAGVIVLRSVPWHAHFTPAKEIGWRFIVDAWGHGYATEAAATALRFAFEKLDWPEVVALTAEINGRSRRVMERLAMIRDPRDDFDHPLLAQNPRLRRHVLYRAARASWKPPR